MLLSRRHRFYAVMEHATVDSIEQLLAPGKAMIAESGWAFLVNDPNEFLRVQFGRLGWDEESRTRAMGVVHARAEHLQSRATAYRKFIVPEKSVVYADYLPAALPAVPEVTRPAQMLAADAADIVTYLGEYMIDARSLGQIYFRGDTHTNWLGAWLVYRYIVDSLGQAGLLCTSPVPFEALIPTIASWECDLWSQLDPGLRHEYQVNWGFALPSYGFEVAIALHLNETMRKAYPVPVPTDYSAWFTSRETIVYEREDGEGPRAVIFRDSTLDLCHALLAQHFSRAVLVWHDGLVVEDVIEREHPDIVLHVMAERFVLRYPSVPTFFRVVPA